MTGRLTVLGGCGAHPEAGRASSGFLVESGGTRVVLDLGYGTLPRLLRWVPDGAVDAVVITHEHADHCVDLHGLYRVLRFGPPRAGRMPLFASPGVLTRVGGLEVDGDLLDQFEVRAMPWSVGAFRLTAVALPHWVPNEGVRVETPDLVVAYTGDTGPDPAVVELGRGADLFVVDASLQGDAGSPYLMSARQAGRLAAEAGAKRLMLTHFLPGTDRAVSVAEAAEAFAGEILTAEEDLVVAL